MARDHFAQAQKNPYFKTEHYKTTRSGIIEKRVADKITKIKNILLRRKNVSR